MAEDTKIGGLHMSRKHNRPPKSPRRRPHIPTLGTTCRQLRDHRGLSRAQACRSSGLSASYLFSIEECEQMPSSEVLDQIIAAYHLDPKQARHLRELRAPAENLEPIHVLRQRVTGNTRRMAHLHDLASRDVLAAYVDPVWNVLASNNLFRTALCGIDEIGSVPVWLFSAMAEDVVVDLPREADHVVAICKANLGRYRDSQQAADLLRRLGPNKQFQERWSASIRIAYGRDTSDPLRLRDPVSGVVTAYTLSVSDETNNVLLLTGLAKAHSLPKFS
ncbi:helix-turn-helix domain-containing protein [Nocardia brasiliensis]|uniref:helix-turn-helix domain-containing protein n=1 Tax=Nocardia brasiliensis TaxID=37326 RepID=UPI00366D5AD8